MSFTADVQKNRRLRPDHYAGRLDEDDVVDITSRTSDSEKTTQVSCDLRMPVEQVGRVPTGPTKFRNAFE